MLTNRRVWWAGVALALSGTSAVANDCNGMLKLPHTPGLFEFNTYSNYSKLADDSYKLITCVENLSDYDLRTFWYIPYPHAQIWTVPNETSVIPRYKDSAPESSSVPGCIEYGNVAKTTRAPFLIHRSELRRLRMEEEHGCENTRPYRATGSGGGGFSELGEFIRDPIRLFFPIDETDPENSMVQMDGEISVSYEGSTIISRFEYSITPLRSNGLAGLSELVLRHPEGTPIAPGFFQTSPFWEGVQLRSKDTISFEYSIGEDRSFSSAFVNIVAPENEIVSGFALPIYAYQ